MCTVISQTHKSESLTYLRSRSLNGLRTWAERSKSSHHTVVVVLWCRTQVELPVFMCTTFLRWGQGSKPVTNHSKHTDCGQLWGFMLHKPHMYINSSVYSGLDKVLRSYSKWKYIQTCQNLIVLKVVVTSQNDVKVKMLLLLNRQVWKILYCNCNGQKITNTQHCWRDLIFCFHSKSFWSCTRLVLSRCLH